MVRTVVSTDPQLESTNPEMTPKSRKRIPLKLKSPQEETPITGQTTQLQSPYNHSNQTPTTDQTTKLHKNSHEQPSAIFRTQPHINLPKNIQGTGPIFL